MNGDRLTRWTAVTAVLAVAAVICYRHAVLIFTSHGEPGMVGHLCPVVIDGLIVAASMALLDSAQHSEKPRSCRCGCPARGSARPWPRTCWLERWPGSRRDRRRVARGRFCRRLRAFSRDPEPVVRSCNRCFAESFCTASWWVWRSLSLLL